MIKQITESERKFSESFTRVHARVNEENERCVFYEFVKTSPKAVLVLREQLKLKRCSC